MNVVPRTDEIKLLIQDLDNQCWQVLNRALLYQVCTNARIKGEGMPDNEFAKILIDDIIFHRPTISWSDQVCVIMACVLVML